MSERTTMPEADPFTPETMGEAQTLVALLRRLGVTTTMAPITLEPSFIFSEASTPEGALVAEMANARWKAEPDFREAIKSAITGPGEAEQLLCELEELGFNASVIWSEGARVPTMTFERSPIGGLRSEAIEKVDEIVDRFETDREFADEMIDHLVGMGAAYKAISASPSTPSPSEPKGYPEAAFSVDLDPVVEKAIEAKIEAAHSQGVDLTILVGVTDPSSVSVDDYAALLKQIGFTREEQEYMAKRSIYRMAQVVLGQKIIETLNAGNLRMDRADVIPCLQAYYEALDAGDLPAAA